MKSLPRGVYKARKTTRYMVQIRIHGVSTHVGMFDTPESASEAYQEAVRARGEKYEAYRALAGLSESRKRRKKPPTTQKGDPAP